MSSHPHPPTDFEPPRAATEVSDGIYAYIQPDQVRGRNGRVAVVEDGVPAQPVEFKTTLIP